MTEADERSVVWGIEWDFLAVDVTGLVALLSSAGYGPIPNQVLAQRSLVERAVTELEGLPLLGDAVDRRDANGRSGNHSDWFRMTASACFHHVPSREDVTNVPAGYS